MSQESKYLADSGQVLIHPDIYLGYLSRAGPTSDIQNGIDLSGEVNENYWSLQQADRVLLKWYQMIGRTKNLRLRYLTLLISSDLGEMILDKVTLDRFLMFCVKLITEGIYGYEQNCRAFVIQTDRCDCVTKLVIQLIIDNYYKEFPMSTLDKVLGLYVGNLKKYIREKVDFKPRLFYNFMSDLMYTVINPYGQSNYFKTKIVISICHTMRLINPANVPDFRLTWLELMVHDKFIEIIRLAPTRELRSLYGTLLMDLFEYLSPLVAETTQLVGTTATFYDEVLNFLRQLLISFPDVLSDYFLSIDVIIPRHCIEIRNLISSATPNDVHMLNYQADGHMILPAHLRIYIDDSLAKNPSESVMYELLKMLQVSYVPDSQHNVSLMNAFVHYLAHHAIHNVDRNMYTKTAHVDFIKYFMDNLNDDGRAFLLNAMIVNLRFPNPITDYFCHLILNLFKTADSHAVKVLITRMLIERLVVAEYQPWGVVFTLTELVTNEEYGFWFQSIYNIIPGFEQYIISLSCAVTFKDDNKYMHEFTPEEYYYWEARRHEYVNVMKTNML